MSGLSVLSIGFTRSLWEESGREDTQIRMKAYALRLKKYFVLVNSYKRHRLRKKQFADNFEGIPTNAFSPVDGFLRILVFGLRILRKERIDLIQAQDPIFTGLAAILLGKIFKIPVNVCVYGPNVFDENWLRSTWSNRLMAPIGRWVLGNADAVQVDGQMTRDRLRAALGKPTPVLVKPVVPRNLDTFLDIPREDDAMSETFSFLFAGRLEKQKNLPMLAEAYRFICESAAEKGVNISLQIAGQGTEEARFKKLLEQAGVLGKVRFLGKLAGSRMPGLFQESDGLLLTSFYEGFPRVLMEAGAAGLPIVTTAVSGSDECVRDGETGFIVPIGDAKRFACHSLELALNRNLAKSMGLAGRRHVREYLDPMRDLGRQIDIWNALIPRRVNESEPHRTASSNG
jgi:glycosyltransferase involved in cell wall biosynthesis